MNDNKKSSKKTRNFATVVYPESAPSNWIELLRETKVAAFVSPLHDKDITAVGEVKKSHYHVMIMFDNTKTVEQAQEIFSLIGGVGCEIVKSVRGYARYLCHLDDPDKVQYDTSQVRCLSFADYTAMIDLPVDRYRIIRDILSFCEDNHIVSYYQLVNICFDTHEDWFRVLCDSGTYIIKEYLKSKVWTIEHNGWVDLSKSNNINFETTEIVEIVEEEKNDKN